MRFLIWIAIGLISFSSCKKSLSKRGCTDTDAENYEVSATIDCECCYYYGKIYMWYDYDFYNQKIGNNVSSLSYYLDGEIVGQTKGYIFSSVTKRSDNDYNSYSDYNPERKQTVIIRDLGKNKTATYFLQIVTNYGNTIWSGFVTIKANTIVQIQLT